MLPVAFTAEVFMVVFLSFTNLKPSPSCSSAKKANKQKRQLSVTVPEAS